jgi:carboxyl-terminal processing protease
MKRVIWALVGAFFAVLLVAGSFLGGMLFQRLGGGVPGSADLGTLVTQVHGIIQDQALVPSSDASMTNGAIDGMLGTLGDKYAMYFPPKEYTDFQTTQKGEFFGVGISVGLSKDGQPQVAQVFDGTPASRAGIKPGDLIVSLNGTKKAKWDLDEFVSLMRGPLGTTVTVEIKRGAAAPFPVTLTREKIVVPITVVKSYPGGVGYVRLTGFNEHAAQDVQKALTDLDAKGAKSYILDLRGNPGGLLTQAVSVVSLFVHDGVVVRVDERNRPEEELRATGGTVFGKPLVVLIDAHSASASEIVTGALKDYQRATIVGETSYGKGSVQTILPLPNGGGLKLTTAHYLTPNKNVINGKGVTPDVVVKMDAKLQADPATDIQLKRAIEIAASEAR